MKHVAILLGFGAALGLACSAETLTVSSDMRIDEDRTVSQIVFTGGYALTGTGRITLEEMGGGILVQSGAATLANPVVFSGSQDQQIDLAAAASLDQTGVWSGPAPLKVHGGARDTSVLHLHGANTFTGDLTADGPCTLHAYGDTAFGTADGGTFWTCGGANGTRVYVHAGTYAETLKAAMGAYDISLQIAPQEAVTFTGPVTLSGTGYLTVGHHATAVFKDALNGGNYFCPYIDGSAVLRMDTGSRLTCTVFNPSGPGTVELAVANGGVDGYAAYQIKGGVTLKMLGENVINSTVKKGGSFTDTATWDLNGYSQNGGLCRGGAATATVTSATPATLTLLTAADPVTDENAFTGAVSLSKKGAGELTLTSAKNTTTGTLAALEGGVTLTDAAVWGGDVDVAADAVLTVTGSKSLRNVTVAAGGRLVLDGTVNVEAVTLGGVEQPRGRSYDATNGGGCIEGTGRLVSYGDKLTVSEDTELADDRYVSAIEFTGGYRLSGAGTIHLLSGGISVAEGTATLENDVDFCGSVPTELTVGAAGVLVQTGVWSGASALKFVGPGSASATHRFELRGANTFTGVVTMQGARIDAYNGQAFGSDEAGTQMGPVGGATGSSIHFHGGVYEENFSAGGVTYSGWWRPVFIEEGETVFRGTSNFGGPHYEIVLAGATAIHCKNVGSAYYCASPTDAGSRLVLTNGFQMTMQVFNPGGGGRNGGQIELYAMLNKEYSLNSARIVAMGENVFSCQNTRGNLLGQSFIDLNGFDQEGGVFSTAANLGGTFYSASPATWTTRMGGSSVSVPYVFEGAASLAKYGSGTLTLTGASTTTGDLLVQEGGVALGDGAAWAGTVKVVAGAQLTSSGNREIEALELAADATLAVEGRLVVNSLVVDGEPLPGGRTYSAAAGDAFLTGAGVLVTGGRATTLTWTGAGAGDDIATAANWGLAQPPDLTSGFGAAVFAASGDRAEVDREVSFSGVTFTAPAFTLDATADGALMALGAGGFALETGAATAAYDVDVPVEFRERTTIAGDGRIGLLAGGTWLSQIDVTDANVRLSGEHGLSKRVSFTATENQDAQGRLYLSNAVVRAATADAELYFPLGNRYYPITAEAGTTNRVETILRMSNPSRPYFAANSETVFTGGGEWGSFCVLYFDEGATAVIADTPLRAMNMQSHVSSRPGVGPGTGARMVFRVAGNTVWDGNYGSAFTVGNGFTLQCEVADVFDTVNQTSLDIQAGGAVDLGGFDQHVGPMRPGTAGGVVRSATPATLVVRQTETIKKSDLPASTTGTVSCLAAFEGQAALEKTGELELDLAAASTTTGPLTVGAGTLGFVDDGAWSGATEIRVAGGVLKLDQKGRISREAVLTVTGGKVDLAAGVSQLVSGGTIGGVPMVKGKSYGSSASGADIKDDRYFTGAGVVRTPGGGLVFSVR